MQPRNQRDEDLIIANEIIDLSDTFQRKERINQPLSASGDYALHVAYHVDDIPLIKRIIALGANLDVVDKAGKTVLHYAAETKNKDMIELLLNAGASLDIVDKEGLT